MEPRLLEFERHLGNKESFERLLGQYLELFKYPNYKSYTRLPGEDFVLSGYSAKEYVHISDISEGFQDVYIVNGEITLPGGETKSFSETLPDFISSVLEFKIHSRTAKLMAEIQRKKNQQVELDSSIGY